KENAGWNGIFPNAQGAVANHPGATTSNTTNNAGNVTVGTISETNNSNNGWTVTLAGANGITLDQDGVGAGSATISNTNPNAGNTTQLFINLGTLTLADNLSISSTSNSTNADGAIRISSTIAGSGNITFNSTSNTVTNSTTF